MNYSDKKAKEIESLTRESIFSLVRMYKGKNINELLLDTLAKFIASLTFEELNMLATTGTVNSLPLKKRNIFLKVFNYNSNYINKSLTTLWSKSFSMGIKHSIGDILDSRGIFDDKNTKFSFNQNIGEFAKKPEDKEKKVKRKANLLKKNREQIASDTSEANKTAQIITKQKLSFVNSVQDINNSYKRGKALEDRYLGSFYITQRKRVLSLDYARKYDNEIKNKIKEFLQKDIAGIKSIRALPRDVTRLEQDIKRNLVEKKVVQNINASAPSARRIVRTELVLAYNFGKLAGYTHPDDIDRLARWNADWELQAKIPGYEICPACRDMHGRTFTIRHLLEIGSITDIGVLDFKGTRNKTDFKNPSLPMIIFHPNCSCFWKILPREEEVAEGLLTTITKGLQAIAPIAIGGALIVGGGFLLSRSNAFKSFIKTAFGEAAKDILEAPVIRKSNLEIVEERLSSIRSKTTPVPEISVPFIKDDSNIINNIGRKNSEDILENSLNTAKRIVRENLGYEVADNYEEYIKTQLQQIQEEPGIL